MTTPRQADWQLHAASELSSLASAWDQINAAQANTPLLDAHFVQLSLRHFGSGKERIAMATVEGAPVAAAVLEKHRGVSWQSFQAAQAPLGAWLQQRGDDTAALLAGLQSALGSACLVLGISQQDPDLLPRPDTNSHVTTMDYIRTARVSTTGSFDDYWSLRGKNLRQNLRRQRNRLNRESVDTRLEAAQHPDTIGAAVDDFGHLESAGWKTGRGTAVHPDNAQGRFYRELLESYSARDEAVVYRYFYDDELVASDLCLHRNGVVYLLKTAYSEAQKTSSPTMLMREETFRLFFSDEKMRTVEFYGRVMDWHTKWSDEIRTMYHVTRYRSALLARLKRARAS